MTVLLEGVAASGGIAVGPAHVVTWSIPEVEHRTVAAADADRELQRFETAVEWARERLEVLRDRTEARLGTVEARIFEPQIMMLEDSMLVDGVVRYIRENHLAAARAFDLRVLELRTQWSRTSHPMVLDRLNDLEDLRVRMLSRMLELPEATLGAESEAPVIVVAQNVSPSLTMQIEPGRILGIATEFGTRTSHWAILARSASIPAVVALGGLLDVTQEGCTMIVDGRSGRVVVDPEPGMEDSYAQRRTRIRGWESELQAVIDLPNQTRDGERFSLLANLDQPSEAAEARRHGAEGVGLFRTEFLVVGRRAMPDEEEQFAAYRQVGEQFGAGPVTVRTFDLGGDKFPMFLQLPAEENPFLGWRAVRVCLDREELFRPQLRAFLRATPHGNLRIMIPLVNTLDELRRVRALLDEETGALRDAGTRVGDDYELGILIETPGAALNAAALARECDFFSIGTNDLVQYALAVDRTSSRLAAAYDPMHPGVVRMIEGIVTAGRDAGIEVSVCGELAAQPLGAFLLLGLGVRSLSVAWPSLPEMKKTLCAVSAADARAACEEVRDAGDAREVIEALVAHMGDDVDLSAFRGPPGLPRALERR